MRFTPGILASFCVLVMLLTACSGQNAAPNAPAGATAAPDATTSAPAATNASAATATTNEGEPSPGTNSDAAGSPYPAAVEPSSPYPAASEANNPTVVPTSSEPFVAPTPSTTSTGNIAGRIVGRNQVGEPAPITGFALYLGNLLKSDQGFEGLVSVDRDSSPKAQPDGAGNFAFVDVPPGRYGLMVDTPRGAVLLNNPGDGGNFIVEVTGGQLLELGELDYPDLDIGN